MSNSIKNYNDLFAWADSNNVNSLNSFKNYETQYDKDKFFLSWNWPAFLFGPLWLCYRRLFVQGMMFSLGIFVVITLVRQYFNLPSILTTHKVAYLDYGLIMSISCLYSGRTLLIDFAIQLIAYILLGVSANWYYGKKLKNVIQKEKPINLFTKKINVLLGFVMLLAIDIGLMRIACVYLY